MSETEHHEGSILPPGARKNASTTVILNCWEFKKCGREPGGKNAEEYGVCPAAVEKTLEGVNRGKCGGRACWNVAGTLCEGRVQGTYASKLASCLNCNFYQAVSREEGRCFEAVSQYDPSDFAMAGSPVRRRLLIPVSAVLLLLVFLATANYLLNAQNFTRHMEERFHRLEKALNLRVMAEWGNMTTLLDILSKEKPLRDAVTAGDKNQFGEIMGAFWAVEPAIGRNKLIFADKAGRVFFHVLGAADTNRIAGDSVLAEAVRSGEKRNGLALDNSGVLWIESAQPWVVDGELAGYILSGQRLDALLTDLRRAHGLDLIFLASKERIDRSMWEEEAKHRAEPRAWDALPREVIIATAVEDKWDNGDLRKVTSAREEEDTKELHGGYADGRHFFYKNSYLADSRDNRIARLVMRFDAAQDKKFFIEPALATLIGALTICAGLVVFFHFFLGRMDEKLVRTTKELRRQIQDRRLAEEVIRASEEKYRAITMAANDAIIIVNTDGTITYWNPAAERLFGFTIEEALEQDVFSLFSGGDENGSSPGSPGCFLFPDVEKGGATFEGMGNRKDGSSFPVDISLAMISIGEDRFAVCMVRDMTERKEAEKERMKLQGQLRQSQKLEAIGTLAGGIAHDFNNILSAILGFASLARDGLEEGSQVHSDLDQIVSAGKRAKSLVQQILAFSRQQGEQEKSTVQIHLIIKEALKLLRPSIPATIDIQPEIDPRCGPILADPTQIHQVLMNLCTNAYHAMREKGGVMTIRLERRDVVKEEAGMVPDLRTGPYVLLTVGDTGCGMDPVTMGHIFEPYFTTKGVGEGTGLGLSVVHGIVKSHNGAMTVESEIGRGSTFSVYLPLIDVSAGEEKKERKLLPTGMEHLLVVDDEEPIVNVTRKRLELLGYKVTTRTSSVEALELFRADPDRFDLVLSDLTMPNVNGVSMIKEMRSIRGDIPAIINTGFSEELRKENLKELGIDAVLLKPVEHLQLAETLRTVLGNAKKKALRAEYFED